MTKISIINFVIWFTGVILIYLPSFSIACTTRGSTPADPTGCPLESLIIDPSLSGKPNHYKEQAAIKAIYYSSDNCNNAYLLLEWTINNIEDFNDELL